MDGHDMRAVELAAIRLASIIDVIERIADDPLFPADHSDWAHEQRRNDYYKFLAEYREATDTLRASK